jgi:hypothetical protein
LYDALADLIGNETTTDNGSTSNETKGTSPPATDLPSNQDDSDPNTSSVRILVFINLFINLIYSQDDDVKAKSAIKGKGKRKASTTPSRESASNLKRRKTTAIVNTKESTLQRQTRAIQLLENSENSLDEEKLADAIEMFQANPEIVTSYLAITNPNLRSLFLNKQLNRYSVRGNVDKL